MMQLDSTVTQPITKERKLVRTYVNRDKKARRGTEVSGQVGSCPVSEKYAYTEHGAIGEQNRETGIDPNLEKRVSQKLGVGEDLDRSKGIDPKLERRVSQKLGGGEDLDRSKGIDPNLEEARGAKAGGEAGAGTSWCYMFIHNRDAAKFSEYAASEAGFKTFVHRTLNYKKPTEKYGDVEGGRPTISGLLFIQGNDKKIKNYLRAYFPQYHVVNDCSTRRTAVIPDMVMQAFMKVSSADPTKIRFMLNPLNHYAKGNTLVRVMTGPMAGLEGYIIRIDRDRRLVMGVGDMTVAIGGVHKEHFEAVEDVARQLNKGIDPDQKRELSELQTSIDKSLFAPASFNDVLVVATNLELWQDRAAEYFSRRAYQRAAEILPFLLEEIGYYFSGLYGKKELDIQPVLNIGKRISQKINTILMDGLVPEDVRADLQSAYDEQAVRHGYLFM
ncbi:MAG: hypothetical protein UFM30_05380 [Bacteroidales bacterium]|nr:hypothetical protein [Bacteroidales bacterium]